MDKKKTRVAVALSGGVDSGVAAALLIKQNCDCTGFHMHLWQEDIDTPRVSREVHPGGVKRSFENKCCGTESLEAARSTAHQLGVPFYTVNFEKIFKKRVVDYFLEEYAAGRTPNPCVMCNQFVKFGQLLDYVRSLGFDYLATGHYARIRPCGRIHHLLAGKDKKKDQSYFLYNLTQKQLVQVLFPVGDYTKKQVWAIARRWQLPVAARPESQEICFFPETDYRPFLRRQIGRKIVPGEVVDVDGRVVGRHQGIPLYTIGQRHGFELKAKSQKLKAKMIPPSYVIAKDAKKNRLVVGFGKEAERKEFWVKEVNWIVSIYDLRFTNYELRCRVRIRHQGELLNCKISPRRCDSVKVTLDDPERGIAPGQAAVFYRGKEVLGGGIINLGDE